MWYSGSDGTTWRILLATSPDGLVWTYQATVVDVGGAGETDSVVAPSVFRESDGTYKMWYMGYEGTASAFLYATSPDGVVWTKHGQVMTYGDSSYEAARIQSPFVLKYKSVYHMWYGGKSSGIGYVRILYATSLDGITWDKHGLAVNFGDISPAEDDSVDYPTVLLKDGMLKMWYGGFDWTGGNWGRTLYATSPVFFDPQDWDKLGIAIPLGSNPNPDWWMMYKPCVLKEDGIYKMWYHGFDGSTYRIMYAWSLDAITWNKEGVVLPPGSPGSTDDGNVGHVNVINDNGVYKMWYGGYDGSTWRIHLAVSPDETSWVRKGVVLSAGAAGQPDDDHVVWQSVIKENGTYRMWYAGNDGLNYRILLASSPDGENWTKKGVVLDLGSPGDPDDVGASDPYIVKRDGLLMMWYYANSGNVLCYATSTDGENWTKHGMAVPRGISGQSDDTVVGGSSALVEYDGYAKLWYQGSDGTQTRIHWARTPTIRAGGGNITSKSISVPGGNVWESVNLSKTEYGVDNTISVSVLDASTGNPIAGYDGLSGTDIDISGISPTTYPSIKLMAHLSGNGSATPVLHEWWVNWTTLASDTTPPDIVDGTGVPETGERFTLEATVTDNIAVNETFVNYRFVTTDGQTSWRNDSMATSGGSSYYLSVDVPDNALGLEYYFTADDTTGNWQVTATVSLDVTDIILPDIVDNTGVTVTTGDSHIVAVSVSDNIGVSTVICEYYYTTTTGQTTTETIAMTTASGSNYTVVLPVPADATEMHYSVTAEDAAGNVAGLDWTTLAVTDDDAPNAVAGPDITIDEMGLARLNASASTDNIGVVNYTWSFIYDGTDRIIYGKVQDIIFILPGAYDVTLHVSDAAGNSDTYVFRVNVLDVTAPTAYAGMDKEAASGSVVLFDAGGCTDNVGVANYSWSFIYNGSSVTLYGQSPEFVFWTPGNYFITLNISDEAGNWATDIMSVDIVRDPAIDGGFGFWWIVVIIALSALIALLLLLALRKKERDDEPSRPAPPPPPPGHGAAAPPPVIESTESELVQNLEKRYAEGHISEETYRMLKEKYGNEN